LGKTGGSAIRGKRKKKLKTKKEKNKAKTPPKKKRAKTQKKAFEKGSLE